LTTKTRMVDRLGDTAVLLPGLIGEALTANDRIKLRLSLLQEAGARVHTPGHVERSFAEELRAAGLAETLGGLVAGARPMGGNRLLIPGVGALLKGLGEDLAAMQAPLDAADPDAYRPLTARAEAVRKALPEPEDDAVDLSMIEALTSADRHRRDSVHLLVMDLHKALNHLAAETAVETLEGARVHALGEADRGAVMAFMRGLNRTAPLAFGHPGLGTTAVRAGGRLTIQNDIGTTDAHVLVIHVDHLEATVTYTDVHRVRAAFFMSLFEGWKIGWSPLPEQPAQALGDEPFYLLTARYAAEDDAALGRFLERLGSRIVFLIDWNKARKALQTFVSKNAAINLLVWGADHDHGHRAFLELGGVDLVFEAIQRAAAGRIPYGVRLDGAIGQLECQEFLQQVLRDTSQGLTAGRTARLIRDEIQAELSRRFETAQSAVLAMLVRHLGLSRMLADALAGLLAVPGLASVEERLALARRAKQLEEKADRLTVSARDIAVRIREAGTWRIVIDEVENAMDALEDCAYFVGLAPQALAAAIGVGPLIELAEIVSAGTGNLIRAVEAVSQLPGGQRADAIASLQAIDAVVGAERCADAAERRSFAAFLLAPQDNATALVLGLEIARALETASDHLSHAALSLRDRVLEELSA